LHEQSTQVVAALAVPFQPGFRLKSLSRKGFPDISALSLGSCPFQGYSNLERVPIY